jgi:hypothetical protein
LSPVPTRAERRHATAGGSAKAKAATVESRLSVFLVIAKRLKFYFRLAGTRFTFAATRIKPVAVAKARKSVGVH